MSLHRAVTLRAAAILAFVGGPALVACGSDPQSSGGSASDSRLGQVRADLSTVGPDGATYALTNESLQITLQGSDAGTSTLVFAQGMPTQTFSLPAGTYQGIMQGAQGAGYPLSRSGDAGATTVIASLTDIQPIGFTVNAGMTTDLTFHFQVQMVGNLTFGTGTLDTAIAVTNSDGGPPNNGTVNASVNLATIAPPVAGAKPNSGIQSLLSGTLPSTFMFSQAIGFSGPFVAGVDSICAPITTPPNPAATGNPNALFDEATGGTGSLCFYDSNGYQLPSTGWGLPITSPIPNAVVLTMTRSGAPQTGQVKNALATSGPATATFLDIVVATPSAPIYDGTTANFAQLMSPMTLTMQDSLVNFDPGLGDQTVVTGTSDPTEPTMTLQLGL